MTEATELAPWLKPRLSQLLAQRGHAWLIAGTVGLGQLDVSLALAASWLCETPLKDDTACGHCAACQMMRAKTHPDLAVLMPETFMLELGWPLNEKAQREIDEKKRKPSKQIKIEAVLNLIQFVQRTSSRGKGLVVLIYPAETLNVVASNALLKSLEEPPGDTRFVLATEDSAALLPTIRSRCQGFSLVSPPAGEAAKWLQVQMPTLTEKDALVWLKAAGGQPRKALEFARTLINTSAWTDFPKRIAKGAAPNDLPAALTESPQALVSALQKLCHDALCASLGAEPRFFSGDDLPTSMGSVQKLTTWSKALNQQVRSAEHTLNAGLMIEALLSEAKESLMVR